jgi:hypothetical protein
MEKEYAREHPRQGYICDLAELGGRVTLSQDYLSNLFSTGRSSGYHFVISGCETTWGIAVGHYRISAVPLEPGKSGWHSFCTDESGVLRYSLDTSPESCFVSGKITD